MTLKSYRYHRSDFPKEKYTEKRIGEARQFLKGIWSLSDVSLSIWIFLFKKDYLQLFQQGRRILWLYSPLYGQPFCARNCQKIMGHFLWPGALFCMCTIRGTDQWLKMFPARSAVGVQCVVQSPPKESIHLRQSQVLKIEGVYSAHCTWHAVHVQRPTVAALNPHSPPPPLRAGLAECVLVVLIVHIWQCGGTWTSAIAIISDLHSYDHGLLGPLPKILT